VFNAEWKADGAIKNNVKNHNIQWSSACNQGSAYTGGFTALAKLTTSLHDCHENMYVLGLTTPWLLFQYQNSLFITSAICFANERYHYSLYMYMYLSRLYLCSTLKVYLSYIYAK